MIPLFFYGAVSNCSGPFPSTLSNKRFPPFFRMEGFFPLSAVKKDPNNVKEGGK